MAVLHVRQARLRRETNKPEDASRYNASIERIESAVRSVIGGDLVLRMSYEPLQIVVERNGVAISLDFFCPPTASNRS